MGKKEEEKKDGEDEKVKRKGEDEDDAKDERKTPRATKRKKRAADERVGVIARSDLLSTQGISAVILGQID